MSDNPPDQPRRNIGQRILLGLFCLALLAFFVVLALDMSDKGGLNRYERQWEAKGEHFDFASFVPKPVPDGQNFALTPIVASIYEKMLDKNGHTIDLRNTNIVNRLWMEIYVSQKLIDYSTNMDFSDFTIGGNWATGTKADLKAWQLYFRELATKTNDFPVAPQAQTPAADVLLALSKYDANIEELRQAAALHYSRFPLNYDSKDPSLINLMHLGTLKQCSLILRLRAIAELQNGQSDKALADVNLILRLIDSVRNEPFEISHHERMTMMDLALQPVWEGLADHRWTDAQLAELNQELAKLDFLADYELSMRGERAILMADIEHLRHTRHFEFFLGSSRAPESAKVALHLIPSSVFYSAELMIARAHQEWILPIVDARRHSVSPEAAQLAVTNINQERFHLSLNNKLAILLLGILECFEPDTIGSTAKSFAYGQSSVDMARVACALERYRLAQGKYPETLDALSPRFIQSVPHDVMGGQPLKYHRTDNGQFALYSVGCNGTDDGGRVVVYGPTFYWFEDQDSDWAWTGQVIVSK